MLTVYHALRKGTNNFHQGDHIAAGQKNARENARSFLHMDVLTPEQIAQGTGLPLEEILALKEELSHETVAH